MGAIHEVDGKEREALEKIREVLDGLPSGSYVKAAFDGACELAEGNLQDGTLDSVRNQIAVYEKTLAKERLALADANKKNAELIMARNRLEEELEEMEKRALSEKCATEIRAIIRAQVSLTNSAISAAAVEIAEAAVDPEGEAFLAARIAYGDRKGYLEVLEMIQTEIGD